MRKNKILLLDEATASCDQKTDSLIQKTIREKFNDFTILTIAHRLVTVMDSDKILVMDNGYAVEYDIPYRLLNQPNGVLRDLVENLDSADKQKLLDIAKSKHEEIFRREESQTMWRYNK